MPAPGSMPYAAMPTRTRSSWACGSSSAPAELATWRTRRSARPTGPPRTRAGRRSSWITTDACPGSSAAARWDQTPTTSSAPACSASAAAAQTSAQSRAAAPLRDSPVSILRWTRARCSTVPAAADERGDLVDRLGGDVDVGRDQRSEVVVGSVQPGEQPAGVPGLANRQRLARGGDPEPARPRRSAPPGRTRASRARTPSALTTTITPAGPTCARMVADVGHGTRPGRSRRRCRPADR